MSLILSKLAGVAERFYDVLVMQGRADPWCPWFPVRVAADLNKLSGWFGGRAMLLLAFFRLVLLIFLY